MPANNPVYVSKYLSDNLNAMHAARESFIEQERSERVRRALLRKKHIPIQIKSSNSEIWFIIIVMIMFVMAQLK